MMELNTRVQVRTNNQLKERATKTLDRMGIDMPTAINMFLTQIVNDQKLPFQPSTTPYTNTIHETETEPPTPIRNINNPTNPTNQLVVDDARPINEATARPQVP